MLRTGLLALLLGARTLRMGLLALLGARTLLEAKGIATRSKDATNGASLFCEPVGVSHSKGSWKFMALVDSGSEMCLQDMDP